MTVENLVPLHLVGTMQKRTAFEVLLFYTQNEYQECQTEADFKKAIYAKFRDYQEALDYARKQARNTCYYKVILRA